MSGQDKWKADMSAEYLTEWLPNLFLNVWGGKSMLMKVQLKDTQLEQQAHAGTAEHL